MPLQYPGPPPWIVNWARPGRLFAADGVTLKVYVQSSYTFQLVPLDGDRLQLFFLSYGNEATLTIGTATSSTRGIFDLYVNGVLDSAGYDDYAAVAGANYRHIILAQPIRVGQNIIELRVNGKNAASTGYYVAVYGASLQ